MMVLDQVGVRVGPKQVLRDVSARVHPGDRVGLVGANGAGKTSLLRVMAGRLDPSAGTLHRRSGARLGWLGQDGVSGSQRSVWDEAAAQMHRLHGLARALKAAEAAVAQGLEQGPEQLADATEAWRLGGGFAQEETIGSVLHGLGFAPSDWQRPCSELSGGWQMRVGLAQLLLSEPDLLLLDEPTNHLDLLARGWLAEHLATRAGTLVVVSHDRWLLDRVCTRIFSVAGGTMEAHTGNLAAWLAWRAQDDLHRAAEAEKLRVKAAHLQGFVDRFGAKASKAKAANARKKQLAKLQEVPQRVRLPPVVVRIPPAPDSAGDLLTLEGLGVGWTAGPDVLQQVDLRIERGMRVAILGRNGAGKSTLMAAVSGQLAPRVGRRRLGHGCRVGVFSQDLARALPVEESALAAVLAMAPMAPQTRIRAALGGLGLAAEAAQRPISTLSGGERARVALAGFLVRPCNLLCLDEPSNHLDVLTVDALAAALNAFEGGVLFSTHDRWLVEALATHVAHVEGGRLRIHAGVSAADFHSLPTSLPARSGTAPAGGGQSHQTRKQAKRSLERARRRILAIEAEIEDADVAIASVDQALCQPDIAVERIAHLAKERAALAEKQRGLYAEWEALEDTLAALGSAG